MKKADISKKSKDIPPDPGGAVRKTAIRFKDLTDIRRFMGRVLNDLDADKITEGKARTLGYLCSVLRDVIKDTQIEERLSKIEKLVEDLKTGRTGVG